MRNLICEIKLLKLNFTLDGTYKFQYVTKWLSQITYQKLNMWNKTIKLNFTLDCSLFHPRKISWVVLGLARQLRWVTAGRRKPGRQDLFLGGDQGKWQPGGGGLEAMIVRIGYTKKFCMVTNGCPKNKCQILSGKNGKKRLFKK